MGRTEFVLSNGVKIPAVGFGTWDVRDNAGRGIIADAVRAGYRYFDTASFYDNEEIVGAALRDTGIKREEVQIASKIWLTELGYDEAKAAFERSVGRLETEYLDVYLIHWPRRNPIDPIWKDRIRDTWRAMEELYTCGKIKAIGLSNFLPHHLDVILESATVKPMIDQLELHPGYMQIPAVEYCKSNGVVVQAWSPLGRAELLKNEYIAKMAERYDVSSARMILAFLNDQDIAVIPKSSTYERMVDNLNIFDVKLNAEDESILKCLPPMGWSGEHPDLDSKVKE